MPNYRRAFRPGGTFFFTLVTYRRARFLCDDLARALLRRAIDACRAVAPFDVDPFVLLPDHLHAMWTLPEGDADFSTRWARINRSFTRAWVAHGGWEGAVSESRRHNRSSTLPTFPHPTTTLHKSWTSPRPHRTSLAPPSPPPDHPQTPQ